MKRKPLRPISEVIFFRKKGQNPNNIEKENIRQRHLRMEKFARIRSESRLLVLAGFLLLSFIGIALKMGLVSLTTPIEPVASSQMPKPSTKRADILDRNGSILATNLITNALYAKPKMMINKNFAAGELTKIFPELKFEKLLKLLENKIVIVTGASRGIGKSIAEECVRQGATVIFTYLSSKEKAEALEAELAANGGKAKGYKSDASKFVNLVSI